MITGVLLFGSGWAIGRHPVEVHVAATTCPPVAEPVAVAAPVVATEPAPVEATADHAMSPEQVKATIATRAQAVVDAIARKDGAALARFVDPERGLEIYGAEESRGLAVAARDVAACPTDKTRRLLSYFTVTCADLFRDHLLPSFARAPEIVYAAPLPDASRSTHPDAIVVSYVVARPEHDVGTQRGWSSLQVVFDPMNRDWRLVELVWKDWLSDLMDE